MVQTDRACAVCAPVVVIPYDLLRDLIALVIFMIA